jgi:hypothetical protein
MTNSPTRLCFTCKERPARAHFLNCSECSPAGPSCDELQQKHFAKFTIGRKKMGPNRYEELSVCCDCFTPIKREVTQRYKRIGEWERR